MTWYHFSDEELLSIPLRNSTKVALSILEKLQVPEGCCSSGLRPNEYTLIPVEGELL